MYQPFSKLIEGKNDELLRPSPSDVEIPARMEREDFSGRQSEPTIVEYWQMLYRRRRTIMACTLGLIGLAALVSFTMTPRYKVESRISVGKENQSMLGFKDEGSAPIDEVEYNMQLDAQVKILTSDTIVLQTLRQLHLIGPGNAPAPRETGELVSSPIIPPSKEDMTLLSDYEDRLEVSRVPHTPIIEIKFTGPDPKLAEQFVNELVRTYIEQNFKTRYESTQLVSGWLSKQLEGLQSKIETSQAALASFQKQYGILGVDDKQNIITQKLDDLNRNLTSAESDRIQKEAMYQATLAGDPELIPGVADNPVIKQLKDQQALIASSYARATAQMGPAHPQVIELKSQLDQIDSALGAEFKKIAGRHHNDYLMALHREQMLLGALNQQKQAANQLNERSIQYQILKHEVESTQQLYDGLSQKLKEAGVSAGLRSGNIRIVDYARAPFSPSVPNIPLNLALGLILGFVGGGTLVFVQERLDSRLRSPRQVETIAELPLIGIVPQIPAATNGKDAGNGNGKRRLGESRDASAVITHAQPNVELMESYRALRTSLLMSPQGPPKVIMVTSALPFEGKTTTSINSAVVLAQKGGRVLLIDADLRAPRIHKVLGLSSEYGLSTLLNEANQINDRDAIVQFSRVPNLFVLPAGPLSAQPSQLLDSMVIRRKIAEWRQLFTHIVIDTPPVLSSSDCLVLSADADSVLLTMMADQTPKAALLRARDLLLSANAKLAGIVVNGVDLNSPDFTYYGYYAYGDARATNS